MLSATKRSSVAATIAGGLGLLVTGRAMAFSPATAACIKQATAGRKDCGLSAPSSTCKAEYYGQYEACFAPGAGVACATNCEAARAECDNPVQATDKACVRGCSLARKTSNKACVGDLSCLAADQAAFTACKKTCAQATVAPDLQCRAGFSTCVASCQDL